MKYICSKCGSIFDFNSIPGTNCPKCGAKDILNNRKPEPQKHNTDAAPRMNNAVCPVCCTPVSPDDESVLCPDCKMLYHKECWEDNKGCATYGCVSAGALEPPAMKIFPDLNPAHDLSADRNNDRRVRCPACGTDNPAGVKFCWSCGATVLGRPAAAPQKMTREQQASDAEVAKDVSKEFWKCIFVIAIIVIIAIFSSILQS